MEVDETILSNGDSHPRKYNRYKKTDSKVGFLYLAHPIGLLGASLRLALTGRAEARSKSLPTILSNEGSHPRCTTDIKKPTRKSAFLYLAHPIGFEPMTFASGAKKYSVFQ